VGLTVTVGCVVCAVLSAAHEAWSTLYRPTGHGAASSDQNQMVAMEFQKEKIAGD
jgi:hypothetical protein